MVGGWGGISTERWGGISTESRVSLGQVQRVGFPWDLGLQYLYSVLQGNIDDVTTTSTIMMTMQGLSAILLYL